MHFFNACREKCDGNKKDCDEKDLLAFFIIVLSHYNTKDAMNRIRKYIDVDPLILTISPTHKCTSSCENCCFGCNPQIDYIMDYGTMTKHIDEALDEYTTIQILVLTGGECFLLGDTLVRIIRYATNKGLKTRVVTNGHWANTYESALSRLEPLVNAGLCEINFSTGDEHAKFVSPENIVNAVLASKELGVQTIIISVESPEDAKLSSSYFKNHPILGDFISKKQVGCIDASWISFKQEKEAYRPGLQSLNRRPCDNIFKGLYINPYSQLLSCCGLTVEYNKFLKLGDLEKHCIRDLYEKQFDDLFKLWLFLEGPMVIYEKVMMHQNKAPKSLSHECAYCMELVRDLANINTISEIIQNEMPGLLFNYKIANSKFIIKQKKH